MTVRQIPAVSQRTVWKAEGRWFLRRDAAYYAIAKSLTLKRFPRWLQDHDLEDSVESDTIGDPAIKTKGDLWAHLDGMPLELWRDRRRRRDELFTTTVPSSYDEPEHDFHDQDKWRRFVKRVAKFLMFVDARRTELDARAAADAARLADKAIICEAQTPDGRRCQRPASTCARRPGNHFYAGIAGQTCTCILRVYPNRCTAHPENNQ